MNLHIESMSIITLIGMLYQKDFIMVLNRELTAYGMMKEKRLINQILL